MARIEEMQLGVCKSDAGMVCKNAASQTVTTSLTTALRQVFQNITPVQWIVGNKIHFLYETRNLKHLLSL